MYLPTEPSTFHSLSNIGIFWKSLTLMYIKASFLALYTVIPVYFNWLIYEMMKCNIAKIKNHNYEVFKLQEWLLITYNFLGFFAKKSWFLLQKHHFYIFSPPKNEFLSKFWTISSHNNAEIAIKHGKKFYVKFMKDFSGLFCINTTRHYENLNIKFFLWWYPLKYIQNGWKKK